MICYEELCRDPDRETRLIIRGSAYLEAMKKFLTAIALERPVFLIEFSSKYRDFKPLTEAIKYRAKKVVLGKDARIPLDDIVEFLQKKGIQISGNLEKELKKYRKYYGAYSILKLRNAIGPLSLDRGIYYLDTSGIGSTSIQRFLYSLSKIRDDYIFIHLNFPVIVHESVPRIVSNVELNIPAKVLRVDKPMPERPKAPQEIKREREPIRRKTIDPVKVTLLQLAKLFGLKPSEIKALELEGLPYSYKYKPLISLGLAEKRLNRLIGRITYVTSLAFGMKREEVREKLEEI